MSTIKTKHKKNLLNSETMSSFAKYFDKIYHDKNYESECRFIIKILNHYQNSKSKIILDLGCGTGNHSLILARKNFGVVGIDKSKIAIKIAKKKTMQSDHSVKFFVGNMTNFFFKKKFDVCLSMFSSMCYLNNTDFSKTINNVKRHLNSKGILIFDFWNGNAVTHIKPSVRVKKITLKNERIIRIATPKLNLTKQTCAIDYHCIVISNDKITDEFNEVHTMHYYFPNDLKNILKQHGFNVLKILPTNSSNFDKSSINYKNNWYLTIVAKLT